MLVIFFFRGVIFFGVVDGIIYYFIFRFDKFGEVKVNINFN